MTSLPDIRLYTWLTCNGIKISVALEELGLPYKVTEVDIGSGKQKEAWFTDINPNGRIPAITDGNKRIFESGAILLYLADRYDSDNKFSYAPGTPEYYEQLSWIMFQMGGVGPMQGQANHFRLFASEYSQYSIDRYMEETKRLYGVLNRRLTQSAWLAGDKYTIADICNYGWVRYAPLALRLDLDEFPALKKWHDAIAEREAVRKGVNVPRASSDQELMQRYRLLEQKTLARKIHK
ncbi:unnamed protein product [Clonostachys rhizophaga]|uniref:Glutathione S-transferase n=1 Tax=Clonostachys rhizophaga TaxID=160324 RepID=A0A9N9VCT0_9HYPO|nr:unnamed protein product [Clonostachys rhizophaga]